jgi:hypothetical protein
MGLTLALILVVAGLATMVFGSVWIGLTATIVGLVALAGVARHHATGGSNPVRRRRERNLGADAGPCARRAVHDKPPVEGRHAVLEA